MYKGFFEKLDKQYGLIQVKFKAADLWFMNKIMSKYFSTNLMKEKQQPHFST